MWASALLRSTHCECCRHCGTREAVGSVRRTLDAGEGLRLRYDVGRLLYGALDIQIVSASLGEIGGGLAAGPDEIAWVQSSYLIAEIDLIPLSGWLSRVMSTSWLFSVSAAGFTATSLLCGWAWDIQSMIVFRGLQGLAGGSMIPTVFTSAFFYFTDQRRVIAAAVIGTISLAPTLGPTIGGWITENDSWHWLFFINLLPGSFVAIAVPMLVHIDPPNLALLRGAAYPGLCSIRDRRLSDTRHSILHILHPLY